MSKVIQLGYLTLGVKDIDRTRDYYIETMGLTESGAADGAHFLSVGYNQHDIILRPADEKTLLHVGYELAPGTDWEAFARHLGDNGVAPQVKTDALPGAPRLIEVELAAGQVVQFFEPVESAALGFSGRGIAPLRLGHVAIVTPEAPRVVAFYRDVLGFYETDWIGDLATFMTCNTDHHVINIVNAPPTLVHHVAFQLSESAQHAAAADKLRAAGIPTKWGPSRHTAGHNLAAYHKDPNDVLIELYTDMDVFLPDLGMCQPRPWHEHLPMKPRKWDITELSSWGVDFQFDLAQG